MPSIFEVIAASSARFAGSFGAGAATPSFNSSSVRAVAGLSFDSHTLRSFDCVTEVLEPALGRLRVEKFRVHVDERGIGPTGRGLFAAELGQLAIQALDELIGGFLGAAAVCDASRLQPLPIAMAAAIAAASRTELFIVLP
jgi:hypothetical protein